MTQTSAVQYPYRMNSFVPRMAFATDVDVITHLARATFGVVPAPGAAVQTGLSVPASGKLRILGPDQQTGRWNNFGYDIPANHFSIPFGCGVQLNTDYDVILRGRDYLGQPMEALYTVAVAGTPEDVVGTKAFCLLEQLEAATANVTTVAITPMVNLLGLPFAAESTAQAGVTLNARDDAQADNTSGDPRGTVTFDTPPDGSTELYIDFTAVTPVGNLGLHGTAQYASAAA